MTKTMYFTFDGGPRQPYKSGEYIVIVGCDGVDCIDMFNRTFAKDNNPVACLAIYDQEEWMAGPAENYRDREPSASIVTDSVYGHRNSSFDDIWLYVPEKNALVYVQEGLGDNLLAEDRDEGYVDYIGITAYELINGAPEETGGGQLMTKEQVRSRYRCLADAVPGILEFLYDEPLLDAQILHTL